MCDATALIIIECLVSIREAFRTASESGRSAGGKTWPSFLVLLGSTQMII